MLRNLIASKGEGIINYSVWRWLISFEAFPLLNFIQIKVCVKGKYSGLGINE